MPGELLVFDMDGVLVDVTDSYRESIRETVRNFTGREISREAIQDFKNQGGWNNDWELSHRIIRDFGVEATYGDVVDYFQRIFFGEDGSPGLVSREHWVAKPGLLERLSERFQFAIFTGRMREELNVTLSRFAGTLIFDPVVTAEDVKEQKPAPEGLVRISGRAPGKKLWYVGDTVDDARSAKAAGVPFIGIAAPSNPRYRDLTCLLKQENAVAVLDDINQLETVLK
jgi:HAD superfamily hydrolase (TIGR01548 family)